MSVISLFANSVFSINNLVMVVSVALTSMMAILSLRYRLTIVQDRAMNFRQNRAMYKANKIYLKSKELELLEEYERMERNNQKAYYDYLNRNEDYFNSTCN